MTMTTSTTTTTTTMATTMATTMTTTTTTTTTAARTIRHGGSVALIFPTFSLRLLLHLHLMMHATKDVLDRRGLEESLEHAARAAVLQALVRRQRVLRAVLSLAELADVVRVRLLVLVLVVALQGVVA